MAAKHSKLTAEYIRELFTYDPLTGELRRKKPHQGVIVGKLAGTAYPDGRRSTSVRGERHKNARLVWIFVTGDWPKHCIDHINGDPSDDRLVNLRDVPHRANSQNQIFAQSRNESSGFLGVSRRYDGTYQSRIVVDGRNRSLGTFKTPEAAHDAYLAAKRKLHAGCTI